MRKIVVALSIFVLAACASAQVCTVTPCPPNTTLVVAFGDVADAASAVAAQGSGTLVSTGSPTQPWLYFYRVFCGEVNPSPGVVYVVDCFASPPLVATGTKEFNPDGSDPAGACALTTQYGYVAHYMSCAQAYYSWGRANYRRAVMATAPGGNIEVAWFND